MGAGGQGGEAVLDVDLQTAEQVPAVRVRRSGQVDHGRRDVDPDGIETKVAEEPRRTAGAAAEIERGASTDVLGDDGRKIPKGEGVGAGRSCGQPRLDVQRRDGAARARVRNGLRARRDGWRQKDPDR